MPNLIKQTRPRWDGYVAMVRALAEDQLCGSDLTSRRGFLRVLDMLSGSLRDMLEEEEKSTELENGNVLMGDK